MDDWLSSEIAGATMIADPIPAAHGVVSHFSR